MNPSPLSLADVEEVFAEYDFSPVNSPSIEPRTLIWMEVNRIGTLISESSPEAGKNLETLCAQLEYLGLLPPGFEMLAYVDISPQAKIFQQLIRLFILQGAVSGTSDIPSLLKAWSAAQPESRLYLFLSAESHLTDGNPQAALKCVNDALDLNNVCIGSQRLLEKIARQHPKIFETPHQLTDVAEYLKESFCPHPFDYLSSGWQGKTFGCRCPAWLPYPTGNILESQSADAVWNSPASIEIRKSILDGSFKYCNRTLCSPILNRTLPKKSALQNSPLWEQIVTNNPKIATPPRMIELNHDHSCNLACPSCRTEVKVAKAVEYDLFSKATETTILPLLKQVNGFAYITGGGEPFASKHYRDLLLRLRPEEFPNLGLILMTNAQLVNAGMWKDFAHLQPMLRSVSVSIDAASSTTYETLRRPGKWSKLLDGMAFLSSLRAQGAISFLQINFVVQAENLSEMRDFVGLGQQWGVDLVWFQRMSNYGSFTAAEFHDRDLTREDHPSHPELLKNLNDSVVQNADVDIHMFYSLIPNARRFPSKFPYFDVNLRQSEKLV